ncbi:MAG: RND transporter [Gemmata sp.]
MFNVWLKALCAAALTAGLVVALGCGKPPAGAEAPKDKGKSAHGEWWCDEHGVPEDECSMCDDKVYKVAKGKGELCPKHPDRAKSQCFICNPDLWEKSAARYKEKYGKEAPQPKDNMPGAKK